MAECNSSFTSDLTDTFNCAATYVESLISQLNSNQLLGFYGLYKQATVGPCDISQPHWFQVQAKRKWEAWKDLGDMSQKLAMEKYIEALKEIEPEWENKSLENQGSKNWVAVSCMHNDEEDIQDADKTLFDWIKDGNKIKTQQIILDDKSSINKCDEYGMLPIHWAADRGHISILKELVETGADKDATDDDGQTPLHYAASCGHAEVIEYLLSIGAKMIEDNNGLTPKDVVPNELLSLLI